VIPVKRKLVPKVKGAKNWIYFVRARIFIIVNRKAITKVTSTYISINELTLIYPRKETNCMLLNFGMICFHWKSHFLSYWQNNRIKICYLYLKSLSILYLIVLCLCYLVHCIEILFNLLYLKIKTCNLSFHYLFTGLDLDVVANVSIESNTWTSNH